MKPRVEQGEVFGKGSAVPRPLRQLGGVVIASMRGAMGSPANHDAEVSQQREAATNAKREAIEFSRFLRREFGQHLEDPLLFRATNLPYQLHLEAIANDQAEREITHLNMTVISEAARGTQFHVTTNEPANNPHPTFGSFVSMGTVAQESEHRELYESDDYAPEAEAELSRDVVHVFSDFQQAYEAGELEIYQLATDHSRPAVYA